ncbi:hypothetical protein A5733_14790 [Mycobacterium sp. NS-7484]|uniref:alpha/beta fold hydrolase n=1 Tax=Mycobacterium sp. NS-7484 TaxID=1834161 RepID=UPI00096F2134|nr:alpha/beta fold hydrolase [Mycobacterium sp. NS-7484]OMB94426.1 hypothetical protein A5733_14790 [Mycobacterium sp. NS-7484]
MIKPGRIAVLAAGWGVLVIALWMGLMVVAAPMAHAEPGAGKSTSQSANDSDKPSSGRDKSARVAPRKEKPRRVKSDADTSTTAPTATADRAPVRQRPRRLLPEAVTDILTPPEQVRELVHDIADRTTKVTARQSLPRTKITPRGDTPEVSVPAATVTERPIEKAAPQIADAAETTPVAEASALVDRVITRSRALVSDVTDVTDITTRAADTPAPRPIARMVAATPSAAATAPSVPIVNIVGSLVFNVVGAALQVFSGPPVLPPGSTVTVRSSTLTMPGSNREVRADWYFPEDPDSATGVIYLQHGFMATGPMYSYTAAYLAEETNSIVVAPTLSSNLFDPDAQWIGGEPMQQSVADLFAGDRPELTASASAAAGHPVALPSKVVLVGHSLGGMLVTGAAGRMVDNGAIDDLAGVVLLDAVDTNTDMPEALAKLSGANYRPVLVISSERYVWNLDGTVGDELEAARPGQFNGVMLVGGRHIDGLQGANPILQFAEYVIAGFSQPQNIDAVKTISAGWINDMYDGTHDGVYGAPQQRIDIPTPSGTATAVVLPFTSTDSVQATPWDGLVDPILDFLFQFAVYEPLAGRSVTIAV